MKHIWKKGMALLCSAALAGGFALTGFAAEDGTESGALRDNEVRTGAQIADFSIRLFQECGGSEENRMISPVSVMAALAMLGNGAEGETLEQMETVFGIKMPELNAYLQTYLDSLEDSKGCEWNVGNSIWLNGEEGERLVKESFLEANAGYHDAQVVSLPFDDTALEQINQWISDQTNGRIDHMLSEISPEALMYLVNAIAFQGNWTEAYEEHQIQEGTFTKEDGTLQDAQFLNSEEQVYLSDDTADGFLKYYEGSRYAFAALLPKEGVALEDYVASLTGERLTGILENTQEAVIDAKIPKFRSEYSADLSTALQKLGMEDAFCGDADFGGVSDAALQVDRVLHRTYIDVNEKGTEAAAATVVEVKEMAVDPEAEELPFYQIYLDRPFLYMIVDTESGIPVFLGTVMGMAEQS